jgi:hypothetical protein
MATETGAKATPPLYKMPQRYRDQTFWVRPPKSKTGAKAGAFLHIGVGDALSSWEFVETATSMLFEVMIESNTVAAGRAYGSITGARARADVLRQAGDVYFSIRRHLSDKKDRAFAETVKHMEACFNAYVANYASASARRNDIAHGIATELSTVEDGRQSWFLVPPLYQSSRNVNWIEDDIKLRTRTGLTLAQKEARLEFNKLYVSNTQYVYGVSDIKVIAGKFRQLYIDLLRYLSLLSPRHALGNYEDFSKFADVFITSSIWGASDAGDSATK